MEGDMGWIDRKRDELSVALFGAPVAELSMDRALAIFNFEAALLSAAERGCACNGDTRDHHTPECYAAV